MGFFASLFGARSEDAYDTTVMRSAIEVANNGLTGVSRYLEDQPSTALSGVEKYLKEHEQNQPSGVAKYLARQAIAEKNQPIVVLSSVEKYLNNNKGTAPVTRTGVEKYLASQKQIPASRVAKYVLQKSIAERNAPARPKVTRVESYLSNLPETSISGVSKYLSKHSTTTAILNTRAEAEAVVEAIVSDVTLTGVEKYLKAQH